MPRYKKTVKGAYTNKDKAERAIANDLISEYQGVNTEPPTFLTDTAKIVFKEMIEAIKENDLKQLDLPLLATYCQIYANIIEATENIKANGLVVKGKINPCERIISKETTQLNNLAKELGFSPNTRARIAMAQSRKGESAKKDPFLKVMSGNG